MQKGPQMAASTNSVHTGMSRQRKRAIAKITLEIQTRLAHQTALFRPTNSPPLMTHPQTGMSSVAAKSSLHSSCQACHGPYTACILSKCNTSTPPHTSSRTLMLPMLLAAISLPPRRLQHTLLTNWWLSAAPSTSTPVTGSAQPKVWLVSGMGRCL